MAAAMAMHTQEYKEVIQGVTPAELGAFVRHRLLARVHVLGLAVGNLRRADVAAMGAAVEACLVGSFASRPPFGSQAAEARCVALPAGTTCRLVERGPNPGNENSALLLLAQVSGLPDWLP